ncbi:MAG: hypothetical protein LLG37_06870 [Spirochaetia bacterium]|nr:hypothetical protein [Spirochaetia bacterium]
MKKLVMVLAITAFFAASAFAGVTTLTKSNVLTGGNSIFGIMIPGNLETLNMVPTDLNIIGNAAVIEYNNSGEGSAAVLLKTDFGMLGVTFLYDIIGLHYSTIGTDMAIGATVNFGTDSNSYDNKEIIDNPQSTDKSNDGWTDVALTLNLAMPESNMNFMLLGSFYTNYNNWKDYNNGNEILEDTFDYSNNYVNVLGGAKIGLGGVTLAPFAGYAMSSGKTVTTADTNTDGTLETDNEDTSDQSSWNAGALVGKEFKANDNITLRLAAGIASYGNSGSYSKSINNVTDTTVYSTGINTGLSLYIPFNVNFEAKLNDTWAFFAGVSCDVFDMSNSTYKYNEDTTADNYTDWYNNGGMTVEPEIDYSIGATMTVGDFKLDACLDPSVLISGGYLVTGSSTDSGDMAYSVGISYGWK